MCLVERIWYNMSEEKDTCKQELPISGLLKFSNLHFEEGALSMLSLHLPALVYLEFDYCTFVDGIQTTQSNVNMPNTTITTYDNGSRDIAITLP